MKKPSSYIQMSDPIPAEEFLKYVPLKRTDPKTKEFNGIKVNMDIKRYITFKIKGTACVKCGVVGTHFILEKQKIGNAKNPHANLYTASGKMMTIDHIRPLSRGGTHAKRNLQPMCLKCNQNKGNKV